MTKVFVEQPHLHWVCKIFRKYFQNQWYEFQRASLFRTFLVTFQNQPHVSLIFTLNLARPDTLDCYNSICLGINKIALLTRTRYKTKIMFFLLLSLQDNNANIPKYKQNQFAKKKLFEFFWEQGLEQNNKTI